MSEIRKPESEQLEVDLIFQEKTSRKKSEGLYGFLLLVGQIKGTEEKIYRQWFWEGKKCGVDEALGIQGW